MSSIRILHASDIHLARRALQRSLPDQYKVIKLFTKNFFKDLEKGLLSGDLTSLKETFAGILSKSSIALLEKSQNLADKEKLNAKIDRALEKLALSEDAFFRDFIAEITRAAGFATSFHPLALDSLVNFAESQSDLHAVILSGDIATTGFTHDLLKAKQFLDGPTAGTLAASQSLSHIRIPVWILPGNHDRYTYTGREWFFAPGGTLFDQILSNHWSGKVKTYPPLRDFTDDFSVLVLAADFGLQDSSHSTRLQRFNKLAQGKVYDTVLTALERATILLQDAERRDYPRHDQVVLWAVHFPPLFKGLSTAKSLLQASDLVNKAKELGVQAILAGHTHYYRDYFAGDVRVLCAGSATQNDSTMKHCQIISVNRRLRGSPAIDVDHYEWDIDKVTFRLLRKK